jgi:hypothetical protein
MPSLVRPGAKVPVQRKTAEEGPASRSRAPSPSTSARLPAGAQSLSRRSVAVKPPWPSWVQIRSASPCLCPRQATRSPSPTPALPPKSGGVAPGSPRWVAGDGRTSTSVFQGLPAAASGIGRCRVSRWAPHSTPSAGAGSAPSDAACSPWVTCARPRSASASRTRQSVHAARSGRPSSSGLPTGLRCTRRAGPAPFQRVDKGAEAVRLDTLGAFQAGTGERSPASDDDHAQSQRTAAHDLYCTRTRLQATSTCSLALPSHCSYRTTSRTCLPLVL